MEKKKVCVTGAGGFVGSWLVKLLLSNHYIVHGTVRDPDDVKCEPLKKLENAVGNLKLFKADLLDYQSLFAAIKGCVGVFHVASPVPPTSVPNPEVQLMEPAVKGTLNVLKAASEGKVRRVVFVSSVGAVVVNPNWPIDKVKDETCWSDVDYCKRTNVRPMVDVRDVIEALRLVYEKPEAEGRYLCTTDTISVRELVDKLKNIYPNYNYPKGFTKVGEDAIYSSEKLQRLGWIYRSLEETLVDSIESYISSLEFSIRDFALRFGGNNTDNANRILHL